MKRMTYANARNTFRDLAGVVDSALKGHRTILDRIEELKEDDRYAPEYKRQLIDAEQAKADQILAAIRQDLDETHAVWQSTARDQAAPSKDANEALLHETRAQRAWERIRPMLDSGRTWRKIVEKAEADRDGYALIAMREEFPAWAQARQKPSEGMAALLDTDVNLDNAHNVIDAALWRALGDDGGNGSAARTRLSIEAEYPVAVAKLDQAANVRAGTPRMAAALGVRFAEQEAQKIAAMLGEPVGSGAA